MKREGIFLTYNTYIRVVGSKRYAVIIRSFLMPRHRIWNRRKTDDFMNSYLLFTAIQRKKYYEP